MFHSCNGTQQFIKIHSGRERVQVKHCIKQKKNEPLKTIFSNYTRWIYD